MSAVKNVPASVIDQISCRAFPLEDEHVTSYTFVFSIILQKSVFFTAYSRFADLKR
jgi:hypothetical protein